MKLKVFYGIDVTKRLPRWWFGDPYIISASALWYKKYKRFRIMRKRLRGEFFLDSGGFSFFHKQGTYPFTPDEYLEFVKIIKPDYFATMDYPCEPEVNRCELRTNLDRIEATVDYGVYLWKNRDRVNSQIIVVIQGYTIEEYQYCYELYKRKNVNASYWAFGTMCRRWKDDEIRKYIREFRKMLGNDVKIHVFGLKISSLNCDVIKLIDSIDTMAWNYKIPRDNEWIENPEIFLNYKRKLEWRIENC